MRLQVTARAALVPGDRPAVLWIKGGVVYVAVHDVYYWKRRKDFRRRIFELHPDRAGSVNRCQWAALQREYDTWLREERRWYAALGLDVPRGERRPVENVFDATYRAVLLEAIRLAGQHGPTAADILGVSLTAFYAATRRRGVQKGVLRGQAQRPLIGVRQGSVVSAVDAIAKSMPAPFRRRDLARRVVQELSEAGRVVRFETALSAVRDREKAGAIVRAGRALKANGRAGKRPLFVHRDRYATRVLRSGTHD